MMAMKIAIVGGGITGLTAAYKLTKLGYIVTVFEKEKSLGGLAAGFKKPDWQWSLETNYHHFFTNDSALINLLAELGLKNKIMIKRPITATLLPNGKISQFDSAINLLTFPYLDFTSKLSTAAILAFLKLNPFWKLLERMTATDLLVKLGGQRAYQILWEPLLIGKFGAWSNKVAASWFWARIQKRTVRLGYIERGFQTLIETLAQSIANRGGKILLNTEVKSILNIKHQILNIQIKYQKYKNNRKKEFRDSFEKVLITAPTPIALKMVPQFQIEKIPHLHAQTLILETKEPIIDKVYWLNIADRSFPFLSVIAQTNFIDKRHYAGHHLTYFGNYLPDGHPYLSMNKDQLLKKFLPYIKRLNPSFNSSFLIHHSSFIGFYAQPVHELHYSRRAPKLETPVKGVYLANLDSIYPWDRGTNYAVELGIKAAKAILATC